MSVPEHEIQKINHKLDTLIRRMDETDKRQIVEYERMRSWTRMPTNYDHMNPDEKRDIGIVTRQEMREALAEFFSPKRLITGILLVGGLINVLIPIGQAIMRSLGYS